MEINEDSSDEKSKGYFYPELAVEWSRPPSLAFWQALRGKQMSGKALSGKGRSQEGPDWRLLARGSYRQANEKPGTPYDWFGGILGFLCWELSQKQEGKIRELSVL